MPRPSKIVREAVAAEKVPSGVWGNSQECLSIRDSSYFQKACGRLLELRQELAAAEEHERLTEKARALRQALANSPLVATSDPLTEAFNATLGRWLSKDRAGVALLLTIVIEIMSNLALTALRLLGDETARESQAGRARPRGEKLPAPKSRDVPGPSSGLRRQGHPPANRRTREGHPEGMAGDLTQPIRNVPQEKETLHGERLVAVKSRDACAPVKRQAAGKSMPKSDPLCPAAGTRRPMIDRQSSEDLSATAAADGPSSEAFRKMSPVVSDAGVAPSDFTLSLLGPGSAGWSADGRFETVLGRVLHP